MTTKKMTYMEINLSVKGMEKTQKEIEQVLRKTKTEYADTRKSVEDLKQQYDEEVKASGSASEAAKRLAQSLKEAKREESQLKTEVKVLSDSYKNITADINVFTNGLNNLDKVGPRTMSTLSGAVKRAMVNLSDSTEQGQKKLQGLAHVGEEVKARFASMMGGVFNPFKPIGEWAAMSKTELTTIRDNFEKYGTTLARSGKKYQELGRLATEAMRQSFVNQRQIITADGKATLDELKGNVEAWKQILNYRGATKTQKTEARLQIEESNKYIDQFTTRQASGLTSETIGSLSDAGIKSQLAYWTKLRDEWVLAKKDATELNAVIERLTAIDKSRNDQAAQAKATERYKAELAAADKLYEGVGRLSDEGLQRLINKYEGVRNAAEKAGQPTASLDQRIKELSDSLANRRNAAFADSLDKMYYKIGDLSDGALPRLISQYEKMKDEIVLGGKYGEVTVEELTKKIEHLRDVEKDRKEKQAKAAAEEAFQKEVTAANKLRKAFSELSDESVQNLINKYRKLHDEAILLDKDKAKIQQYGDAWRGLQDRLAQRKASTTLKSVEGLNFMKTPEEIQGGIKAIQSVLPQLDAVENKSSETEAKIQSLRARLAELQKDLGTSQRAGIVNSGESAFRGATTGSLSSVTDMNQAIKDMQEWQKIMNVSTDEGKQKYREVGDAIARLKDRLKELTTESKDASVVLDKYADKGADAFKKSANELEEDKRRLEEWRKELAKTGENANAIEAIDNAIKGINRKLAETGKSAKDWKQMLQDAREGKMTYVEMKDAVAQMRTEMENTAKKGNPEWKEKQRILTDMDRQLKAVNQDLGYHASTLQQAVSRLKNYVLVYIGFNQIMMKIRQTIQKTAELSDKMTNVQKVTGMTNEEITKMTDSLQGLDTRVSSLQLMDLAEQAGKLGLAMRGGTDAIVQFAEVGQKIMSTIGEDVGGAEAISDLLKINDLVNKGSVETLEMQMNRVGSAILDVGNKSKASYGGVMEFTKRVGAVGSVAGLNMQQIVALGGTYSALGASMEQSATAVNRFMIGINNKTDDIAKAANVSVVALRNLIQDGKSFEALQMVINGIKDEGLVGVQRVLRAIGGRVNAQLTSALALLVDNYDTLISQLNIANNGYEQATTLGYEFDRMNNNLAGTLKKIGNAISETFVNSAAVRFFQTIIEGLYNFGMWANRTKENFIIVTTAITYLTTALIANRLAWVKDIQAMGFAQAISKATAAWHALTATIATSLRLHIAFYGTFRGTAMWALDGVKGAFVSLGASIKAFMASNWLTLLIAGLTAAGVAIYNAVTYVDKLAKKLEEAAESGRTQKATLDTLFATYEQLRKRLADAQSEQDRIKRTFDESTKSLQDENGVIRENAELTSEQEALQKKLRDATDKTNSVHAEFAGVINQLNQILPQYCGYQIDEYSNAQLVAAAHHEAAAAIRDEIRAKQEQAMTDYAVEQTIGDITERGSKLRTKAKSQQGTAGRDEQFMQDIETYIAEAIDKDITDAQKIYEYILKKTAGRYNYQEQVNINGKTMPGRDRSAVETLRSYIIDYIKPYIEQEKIVQQVATRRNAGMERSNNKKRSDVVSSANALQRQIHELVAKTDKSDAEWASLEQYVRSYITKFNEDSDPTIQKNIKTYRKLLSQLTERIENMRRKSVWGFTGVGELKKMTSEALAALYDRIEKAAGSTAEEADYAEIFPEFAQLMKGKSADEARDVLRGYAEQVKAELESRGMNTGAHFKWNEKSGGKDKWKQEAKEQYDAYLKELDDYYVRRQIINDRRRAAGIDSEEEYNHRTEALEKKHLENRSKLRNMFLKGNKSFDKEVGVLTEEEMKEIFGKTEASGIAHTGSLLQKMGDATVDEIRLKSDEDRVKVLDIMRKNMSEMEKALLESHPLEKVLDDFREKMNSLHLIFGAADYMSETTHGEDEYQHRLDMMYGYLSRIHTMSLDEFRAMIKETDEFASFMPRETEVMYEELLTLRDEYDQAAKRAAKKSLKLYDLRYENGQWLEGQLKMLQQYISGLEAGTKEYDDAYAAISMLMERRGMGDNSHYNRSQKALADAKAQVAREQAIGNSGVDNSLNIAKAERAQAEQELHLAAAFLAYRKSLYDADVKMLEVQKKELEDLLSGGTIQKGTQEYIEASTLLDQVSARLFAKQSQRTEAVNDAQEKLLEAEKNFVGKQADLLSQQVSDINSWMNIFREAMTSMASAGDQAAEGKAFELAELRAQKSLGWISDYAKTRTLIVKQNGDYEIKYLTQEERMLEEIEIERRNARADAWVKFINDFGEQLSKKITDIYQRQAELNDIQSQEQAKNAVIEQEQQTTLANQASAEQAYTQQFINELQVRPEAMRESYRQMGVIPEEEGTYEKLVEGLQTVTRKEEKDISQTTDIQMQSDSKKTKSHEQAIAKMIGGLNLYSTAYSIMTNDSMSASEKMEMFMLQTVGQGLISMLTAQLPAITGQVALDQAGSIAKAFSQLGPIGGAAAIAGITAMIGLAMGAATNAVSKSKSEIASATGASNGGKLVTGMLTYGNGRYPVYADGQYDVQGNDGHNYNAHYEKKLNTGVYRGGAHFGIFSEKLPEAVIDGPTTRRITMDYDGIWKDILSLSKTGSLAPGSPYTQRMNAYANGNLSEIPAGNTAGTVMTDNAALIQMIAQNNAIMQQLQVQLSAGIRARMTMFGDDDSLDSSIAKMNRMKKKYGLGK